MHLASFPGQSLPLLSRESLGTRLACIYVYVSFHLLQYSGWQRCMCHYKEVSAIREAVDEGRFHFLRASLGSVFDAYVYKIQEELHRVITICAER